MVWKGHHADNQNKRHTKLGVAQTQAAGANSRFESLFPYKMHFGYICLSHNHFFGAFAI